MKLQGWRGPKVVFSMYGILILAASLVTFGTSRASRDNLRDTDTKDPSKLDFLSDWYLVVLTVFCYFIGHELIHYQRIRSSQDTVLYCTLLHCVYVYFHVHAFIFWHKFVGSARLTVNKSARVLRGCKFDRILPSSERVWRTAPHELDCLHMDCWRICSDMLWGVEEWKRSLTKLWNGSIWSKTFFFQASWRPSHAVGF